MSLIVGRISYLPDLPISLRKFRWENQLKMYKDLMAIKPDGVLVVKIAQNYKNMKKYDSSFEESVKHYDKLGPARARNLLLKSFYRSNFDFMLLLDDDISLYNYYQVDKLLDELHNNSQKFVDAGLHIVKSLEPQYVPFKKENEKLDCDNQYVFEQGSLSNGCGFILLVNFKKHYNKEYYFDETIDLTVENEGLDFFIRIMQDNFTVLDCRNFIQKNYANGKSTVFQSADNIDDAYKTISKNTAIRYGIPIENDRIKFSKVLKYYEGKKYIRIS